MKYPQWLEEIEDRTNKATAGPWIKNTHDKLEEGCLCLSCYETDGWQVDTSLTTLPCEIEQDANFIAHSRTDVPKLIKALKISIEALISISGRGGKEHEDINFWMRFNLKHVAEVVAIDTQIANQTIQLIKEGKLNET